MVDGDRARASAQALAAAAAEPAAVAAVGLTGQMHGLVLLDAERSVLRPAILWNDQRTGARVRRDPGADGRARGAWSGSPATTRSPASPRPRSSGSASTSPRSTPGRASCCCPRTTCGCASPAPRPWTRPTARARCSSTWPRATGRGRSWPRSRFPASGCRRPSKGPRSRARSRAEAAAETGLARGDAGGGGRRRPGGGRGGRGRRPSRGRGRVTLGHLGRGLRLHRPAARRAAGPPPRLLPRRARQVAPHGRDPVARRAACSGTATRSRPGESFDALVAEAASAPPGSEGAAVPPLPLRRAHAVSRTPWPAARSSASRCATSRGHLTRAVLEGVAFSLRDCFALLREPASAP